MPDIKIVKSNGRTIMISLPESILFASGEARVRPEALPFLKALAQILIEMDRHVESSAIRTMSRSERLSSRRTGNCRPYAPS
ncbi:MAG: hypothetical protein MRJ92_05970 [Nitrospira sp.]|nr:hypothetical protein [Nitrospira sp.]